MDTELTFFEVCVFILRQCRGIRTPTLGYQAIGTVAGIGGGGGGWGYSHFFLDGQKLITAYVCLFYCHAVLE